MAKAISTKTTVIVSMGVLLTIGAMLVAAPSAYAEKTCIGACKNRGDTTIDASQDTTIDSHDDNSQTTTIDSHDDNSQTTTIDSHDTTTIDSHDTVENTVEAPCTAPGGTGGTGGPGGGTGGVGGSGGCNRT
jgi:hypothetical protein